MKIYTWEEGMKAKQGIATLSIVCVFIFGVLALWGLRTGWIEVFVGSLMFAGGIAVLAVNRLDTFRAFGPAFIVDAKQNVLGYYPEGGYVRKRELKEGGGKIIPHKLGPIDEKRQLRAVVDGKIMTVCVRARVFCHAKKHQLYFDKFLRSVRGAAPTPNEIVGNLLAVFLRQNESALPGMYDTQGQDSCLVMELLVGDLLAGYLLDELASSALQLDGVGCKVDVETSSIS
ncbi:MAG: hypothetical protein UT41_C0001G0038 [Candidatus Wolfebacteria bacterium GW2011_GWC2_39_22]|uniref:Band 7 domain-containing protein n=2 Tax=Candidatus Wolfeibacteriota TaxID=1752735 RepID=A0A0G1H7T5_9BACT|nr:MAG: hypothetical protein UT41_C0001G0038 [Candidatus Wolfebacteria bacterium GW2011_GWC2_39_22]KKT43451.1 MAG: hypothetical protein UW32_C0001G0043 [Candidatus Wolfebacteria bacterium GW2011_GWE2_44_13]HBI25287.1 hypothetical protein [Candidatus Wolfebacteria bacterium]